MCVFLCLLLINYLRATSIKPKQTDAWHCSHWPDSSLTSWHPPDQGQRSRRGMWSTWIVWRLEALQYLWSGHLDLWNWSKVWQLWAHYRLIWSHPWKIIDKSPLVRLFWSKWNLFPPILNIFCHSINISKKNIIFHFPMLIVTFCVKFGVNMRPEVSHLLKTRQLHVFKRTISGHFYQFHMILFVNSTLYQAVFRQI